MTNLWEEMTEFSSCRGNIANFFVSFLIFLFLALLFPPRVEASTDLSPILTSPIASTTPDNFFALYEGDQRTAIVAEDCIAPLDNGGFSDNTFDLFYYMTIGGYPLGTYTIALGTLDGGCAFNRIIPLDVYGIFYWNGSAIVPDPDSPTHIDFADPFYGSIQATGTPITASAGGVINAVDNVFPPNLSISWSIRKYLGETCLDPINCTINISPSSLYRTDVTGQSEGITGAFFESSTTNALSDVGFYEMRTSIDKPTSFLGFQSFLGFSFGYTSLDATTTLFAVGTQDTVDQILARINAGTQSASTTIELTSCIPIPSYWKGQNCINALFVPHQTPDYQATINQVAQKAPFGYFAQVTDMFSGTTTAEASTTASGLELLGSVFEPIKTLFALVLWLLFSVWVFKRLSHFNFQT